MAELLGAAPGSPVATELTSMQQMLITTSQRLIELEAKQNENDELERIKSMVEEQKREDFSINGVITSKRVDSKTRKNVKKVVHH